MSKSAECDLDKATKVARPFHFLIPFWGQRYREYFVNYCLPSLLAPNNLPLLEAKDGHVFLIATTADDWQAIEALPIMGRLRRHVLPKFLEIPHPKTETAPGSSNAIMYLNVCQRRLVEAAYRERCYGCLLWPDFILSDGMVASLLRDVSLGCHLVLAAAIRQVEENVVGELVSRGYLSGNIPCSISGDSISIPPRILVDLQVRHLHSEVTKFEEGVAGQQRISPFRFWEMPQGGLLLHTFLLHPVLMDFGAIDDHDTDCLDFEVFENVYLGRNFYGCGGLRIVEDSDEFGILSLTPEAIGAPNSLPKARRPRRGYFADLAARWGIRASMKIVAGRVKDPVQRDSFLVPIRWHRKDLDEQWYREERRITTLFQSSVGDCYKAGQHEFLPRFNRRPKYLLLDLIGYTYYGLVLCSMVLRVVRKAMAGDAADREHLGRIVGRVVAKFRA